MTTRSKFFHFLIGVTIALSLVGVAGVAKASTLTTQQISAFLSFLNAFGIDQSVIDNVSATLSGRAQVGTAVTPAPSVTIDPSSLNVIAGNPTLTGSAKNMRVIMVKVVDSTGAFVGNSDGRPGWVTADGRWSTQLAYIPAGTYTLQLYGNGIDEEVSTARLLMIATLTVSAR